MFAVIFEVVPGGSGKAEYLEIAAELRRLLENRDGFISIERFQSLNDEGKILSLSFWRDEEAIATWRNEIEHRSVQQKGKCNKRASHHCLSLTAYGLQRLSEIIPGTSERRRRLILKKYCCRDCYLKPTCEVTLEVAQVEINGSDTDADQH